MTKEELNDLEAYIAKLKRESKSHKKEIEDLEREKSFLMEKSRYLIQKLNEASVVYEEAGKRVLDFVEAQITPTRNLLEEFKPQIKNIQEIKKEQDDQKKRLLTALDDYRKRTTELKSHSDDEIIKMREDFDARLGAANKQIERLKEQISLATEKQVDKSERSLKRELEIQRAENEEIRKELDTKIAALDKHSEFLNQRIIEVTEKHLEKKSRDFLKEFDIQKKEIFSLGRRFELDLERMRKDLELKRSSDLKDQTKNLKEEVGQISAIKRILDAHENEIEDLREREVQNLNMIKKDLQIDFEELKKDLLERKKEDEKLLEKIIKDNRDLASIEKELEAQYKEITELRKADKSNIFEVKKEIEASFESLKKEINDRKKENDKLLERIFDENKRTISLRENLVKYDERFEDLISFQKNEMLNIKKELAKDIVDLRNEILKEKGEYENHVSNFVEESKTVSAIGQHLKDLEKRVYGFAGEQKADIKLHKKDLESQMLSLRKEIEKQLQEPLKEVALFRKEMKKIPVLEGEFRGERTRFEGLFVEQREKMEAIKEEIKQHVEAIRMGIEKEIDYPLTQIKDLQNQIRLLSKLEEDLRVQETKLSDFIGIQTKDIAETRRDFENSIGLVRKELEERNRDSKDSVNRFNSEFKKIAKMESSMLKQEGFLEQELRAHKLMMEEIRNGLSKDMEGLNKALSRRIDNSDIEVRNIKDAILKINRIQERLGTHEDKTVFMIDEHRAENKAVKEEIYKEIKHLSDEISRLYEKQKSVEVFDSRIQTISNTMDSEIRSIKQEIGKNSTKLDERMHLIDQIHASIKVHEEKLDRLLDSEKERLNGLRAEMYKDIKAVKDEFDDKLRLTKTQERDVKKTLENLIEIEQKIKRHEEVFYKELTDHKSDLESTRRLNEKRFEEMQKEFEKRDVDSKTHTESFLKEAKKLALLEERIKNQEIKMESLIENERNHLEESKKEIYNSISELKDNLESSASRREYHMKEYGKAIERIAKLEKGNYDQSSYMEEIKKHFNEDFADIRQEIESGKKDSEKHVRDFITEVRNMEKTKESIESYYRNFKEFQQTNRLNIDEIKKELRKEFIEIQKEIFGDKKDAKKHLDDFMRQVHRIGLLEKSMNDHEKLLEDFKVKYLSDMSEMKEKQSRDVRELKDEIEKRSVEFITSMENIQKEIERIGILETLITTQANSMKEIRKDFITSLREIKSELEGKIKEPVSEVGRITKEMKRITTLEESLRGQKIRFDDIISNYNGNLENIRAEIKTNVDMIRNHMEKQMEIPVAEIGKLRDQIRLLSKLEQDLKVHETKLSDLMGIHAKDINETRKDFESSIGLIRKELDERGRDSKDSVNRFNTEFKKIARMESSMLKQEELLGSELKAHKLVMEEIRKGLSRDIEDLNISLSGKIDDSEIKITRLESIVNSINETQKRIIEQKSLIEKDMRTHDGYLKELSGKLKLEDEKIKSMEAYQKSLEANIIKEGKEIQTLLNVFEELKEQTDEKIASFTQNIEKMVEVPSKSIMRIKEHLERVEEMEKALETHEENINSSIEENKAAFSKFSQDTNMRIDGTIKLMEEKIKEQKLEVAKIRTDISRLLSLDKELEKFKVKFDASFKESKEKIENFLVAYDRNLKSELQEQKNALMAQMGSLSQETKAISSDILKEIEKERQYFEKTIEKEGLSTKDKMEALKVDMDKVKEIGNMISRQEERINALIDQSKELFSDIKYDVLEKTKDLTQKINTMEGIESRILGYERRIRATLGDYSNDMEMIKKQAEDEILMMKNYLNKEFQTSKEDRFFLKSRIKHLEDVDIALKKQEEKMELIINNQRNTVESMHRILAVKVEELKKIPIIEKVIQKQEEKITTVMQINKDNIINLRGLLRAEMMESEKRMENRLLDPQTHLRFLRSEMERIKEIEKSLKEKEFVLGQLIREHKTNLNEVRLESAKAIASVKNEVDREDIKRLETFERFASKFRELEKKTEGTLGLIERYDSKINSISNQTKSLIDRVERIDKWKKERENDEWKKLEES